MPQISDSVFRAIPYPNKNGISRGGSHDVGRSREAGSNAKVGEYVTVARKHGIDWYIGAMTNWTPREFTLTLDFLDAGKYKMIPYADGLNAGKWASYYKMATQEVTNKDEVIVHLAPGGGWVARVVKME